MHEQTDERDSTWVQSFASPNLSSQSEEQSANSCPTVSNEELAERRRIDATHALEVFLMAFASPPPAYLVIERLEATTTLESSELASGFGQTLGSQWDTQPEGEHAEIGMALLDPVVRANFLARKFNSFAQKHSMVVQGLLREQHSMQLDNIQKPKWSMHDVATMAFCIGSIVFLVAASTFSTQRYELDPDSPDPVAVHSSWWGLVTERLPLRYMKEGFAEDKTWCAQNANKQWLPYFRLDDPRFENDFEY